MARWVLFDAVKAQVSIEDILRRYGRLESLKQKGAQLIGLCPFHTESTASFKVTPARNIWRCFGCRRGGDAIDLVCCEEGLTDGDRDSNRRKAALLMQAWFGVVSERPAPTGEPEKAVEATPRGAGDPAPAAGHNATATGAVNPPLGWTLKNLDYEAAYAYAETRGIHRATAEQFGLGVARAGGYKGRLVIPIHDHDGILVGYGSRALDEREPKYLFPPKDKGFYKSHLVFNLSRVVAAGHKAAIIVEGFVDCMKVTQAGFPAVALMGCEVSERQAELLCACFERLVLFLDSDHAGRSGTDRALVEIGRRGRYVRAVRVPQDAQPDQLSEEAIAGLLKR